jgi:Kef-type K+ transport system membrane component KefB
MSGYVICSCGSRTAWTLVEKRENVQVSPIHHKAKVEVFIMLPFLQLIFAIAVIIAAAKAGGYLSYKLGQPAVAGEVLAGLVLGPSVLNFYNLPFFTDAHLDEAVIHLAELGVLLLMFIAGLELHLEDLSRSGKAAALTGILGFLFTLGMGYSLAIMLGLDARQALFLGIMLAPTSIGISAQTLIELDVLWTNVGTTLLGSAAIDDILGVLGLSLSLALMGGAAVPVSTNVGQLLLEMGLFLVIASAFGFWLLPKIARFVEGLPISQGLIAFSFTALLIYAWSAEVIGHMATVIGAFMAGLFLAQSPLKNKIRVGFLPIAYGIFVPIFFSNVGLSADFRQFSIDSLLLLAGMVVVVIVSKLLGAGIGSRIGGMQTQESLQLGFGMIPRGEVVLIIATIGITEGIIGNDIFSASVMLVVITTLMTPPILQFLFAKTRTQVQIRNNGS